MQNIIVLKGEAGVGKSTTIKQILEQIFEIKIYRPKIRRDIVLSFKYKGKIIAILSLGDIEGMIIPYFEQLANDGFDILICACRPTGKTYKFYKDKDDKVNYDVQFIPKTTPIDEEQDKIISDVKIILENLLAEKKK